MFTKSDKERILVRMKAEHEEIRMKHVNADHRLDNLHFVALQLRELGYDCDMNGNEVIRVIENNHVDVSKIKFPDGSYDAFKESVQNGRYDVPDFHDAVITGEERRFHYAAVKAGEIFEEEAEIIPEGEAQLQREIDLGLHPGPR